jgi:hypothetical protein
MTSNKRRSSFAISKSIWRAILLSLLFAILGFAEVADLKVGAVQLPAGWTQKRTGTIDSERGQITGPNGKLIVNYDIGAMAGIHMSDHRKAECIWYKEQMIHGRRALIGLVKTQAGRALVVTFFDRDNREWAKYPANFWSTVQDDEDIADTLLIALSYEPKP